MKIVVFETEEWELEPLRSLADGHEVEFVPGRIKPDNAADYADADIISPFVYSTVSADTIAALPNLQMIATRSTGYDHIDVDACKARGIALATVPTYGDTTVAEHVFALLLAVSHKMVEATDRTRRGDFHQAGLQGFDLRGKTMGIVGTGHIGKCTIRIAKGFDMTVIAHDIAPDQEAARQLGFDYVPFPELLSRSDVVSLHVPGGSDTDQFMDDAAFDAMKDGAVIINTGRGNLIDVNALLKALATGKIAGAGLDVLPEEPTIREEAELLRSVYLRRHNLETLLADHVLLHMRNVVITPHSAFNTREAVQRILETTRQNIDAFLAGDRLNQVI
ncbi:2-hydroxyacid dehydrogenase [Pyruvatibacter sp. HU-CL02332]|uniref:hydroxyacid dehydrogenase n=1 Tax=Pyruvatibacter sp. HU-CL02332 TaxID=3127650 RepID=UPI00310A67A9